MIRAPRPRTWPRRTALAAAALLAATALTACGSDDKETAAPASASAAPAAFPVSI